MLHTTPKWTQTAILCEQGSVSILHKTGMATLKLLSGDSSIVFGIYECWQCANVVRLDLNIRDVCAILSDNVQVHI
jgi:hypothetical protein